jgi:hypothetical protein
MGLHPVCVIFRQETICAEARGSDGMICSPMSPDNGKARNHVAQEQRDGRWRGGGDRAGRPGELLGVAFVDRVLRGKRNAALGHRGGRVLPIGVAHRVGIWFAGW